MILTPFLAALALVGSGYRDRFPLPDLTAGAGWGVNIHFTDPEPGEMAMIRDAGFKWVRMDLTWQAVERRRGVYDFRAYDRLMDHLTQHGMRALLILDYGNDLYEPGAPKSPEARRAFARFAQAAFERYRGRGVVWELWNEPNLPKFWQPKADAGQYAALAHEVGRTLRRVAPDEWFVGPATSRFDWPFLERCFDEGLLDVFDALTIHPYRHEEPETVAPDWHRLRRLIASHTSRDVPLLSGEWGYSERFAGQNAAKQAQFAQRQYLANLASGVGMSIWYDWRNDGPSPTEIEHHFGTVDLQMRPKPAYTAIRDLSRQLAGTRFDRRLPAGSGEWRYLFAGPNPKVVTVTPRGVAVEAPSPAQLLTLQMLAPGPGQAVDGPEGVATLLGPLLRALGPGERLGVEMNGEPVALLPSPGAFEAVAAALRRDPEPKRVTLSRHLASGEFTFYEGLWTHARPVRITLKPSGALGRLMVDLALEGPPSFERLTVELHLGGRVLEESVRVGRGGALVGFPWYPWESRSHLEIRVKNAEGAVLSTHGPVFAAPVDLLDVRGLTLAAGGDPAVRAEVSHMLTDAPPGGPSTKALRIDYRFSPGWKYWALIDPRAVIMEGRPEAYSVWVYGDGSGDDLRMRFVDATGQTFQCDLATIDFKGWKQLRCSLKGDRAGYWGGALDGVVHHPIRITVPALIDGVSRRGTRGTLFLAEGHVVGRE